LRFFALIDGRALIWLRAGFFKAVLDFMGRARALFLTGFAFLDFMGRARAVVSSSFT
jgi:hypothetical protein